MAALATRVNEDGTTWIDFRKLREIELGIAKVSTLNNDQNTAVNELSKLKSTNDKIWTYQPLTVRSYSYNLIRKSETSVLNLYNDQ